MIRLQNHGIDRKPFNRLWAVKFVACDLKFSDVFVRKTLIWELQMYI